MSITIQGRDTCNGSCETAPGCNCRVTAADLARRIAEKSPDYLGSDEGGPMFRIRAAEWLPFVVLPLILVILAALLVQGLAS